MKTSITIDNITLNIESENGVINVNAMKDDKLINNFVINGDVNNNGEVDSVEDTTTITPNGMMTFSEFEKQANDLISRDDISNAENIDVVPSTMPDELTPEETIDDVQDVETDDNSDVVLNDVEIQSDETIDDNEDNVDDAGELSPEEENELDSYIEGKVYLTFSEYIKTIK